ncbi:hypothetical protein D3C83_129280 [compost metagenome]
MIPVIVGAASIALMIASSVACTVARKSGEMRAFDSIATEVLSSSIPVPAFAVEKAMKMSPDPLDA